MQSQAVTFTMFLAFFPMLLLAFGMLSVSDRFRAEMIDLPRRLEFILPPDADRMVMEYILHRGLHPLRWILLGLGGTLLAGTQVMSNLMDGFRTISGVLERRSYLVRQLRALGLLCLTFIPALAVMVFTVFGRQMRRRLIRQVGYPLLLRFVGTGVYFVVVFLLALGVLMLVYHIGQPGRRGWREILPGAAFATILWWLVDAGFGFYVHLMPYGVVYGGLAAAIGLILWLYFTATVILLGAAYNVEAGQLGIFSRAR